MFLIKDPLMQKDMSYIPSTDTSHVIGKTAKHTSSAEKCASLCAFNQKSNGCQQFSFRLGSGENCWLFNSNENIWGGTHGTFELGVYSGKPRARGNVRSKCFNSY